MPVPSRLSFVTIGARNLTTLSAFYRRLGWKESENASDTYTSFDCGGVRLALFPLAMLRDEAAPGAPLPDSPWNGITLAVNLPARADVDRALRDAVTAGASAIAEPVEREWGGYSAYIADPEGTRWELAWAPD